MGAGRLKVEGECSKRGRKRDLKREALFCQEYEVFGMEHLMKKNEEL
jgi:hypothetical protein